MFQIIWLVNESKAVKKSGLIENSNLWKSKCLNIKQLDYEPEQIVNEAQPRWLSLVENEGEYFDLFSINLP